MPVTMLDASRFINKRFTRRLTWPDRRNDYVVRIDNMTAARITLATFAGSVDKWTWTIIGPYIPQELQPSHGAEDTLEAAQEAFKAKFWQWHRWAMERPSGVTWMV